MFRSLGFETETEIAVYERDLTTRLPAIPPLPAGFEAQPLADVPAREWLELITAPMRRVSPDLIERKCAPDPDDYTEEWVKGRVESPHTIRDASLAAYQEGGLVAAIHVYGVTSWEFWLYEPGTSVFIPYSDTDADLQAVMPHLQAVSLKVLKKAGFKTNIMELSRNQETPWPPILESLGFRHVRSKWNLRLRLKGDD